jgi:hypothetical protein
MTTQEIEKYLERQYSFKKPQIAKFPDEVKTYIFNYAKKYNWEGLLSVQHIFKNMNLGYKELPNCQYENCSKKVKITDKGQLTKGCCKEHSKRLTNLEKYGCEHTWQAEVVKDKIVETTLTKFGVKHNSQSEIIKKQKVKTSLEKYGVESPMSLKSIQQKMKETLNKNYGVNHPMLSNSIKNKVKNTCLKNYGVENPSQSEKIKSKKKTTSMEKFGVEYFLQSDEGKENFRTVCLEKYGVENPTMNHEIFEKVQDSIFKKKDYIWKTGEISKVQGYEDKVLKELEEKGYTFDEVKTLQKDIPAIWYDFNGNKKRYYPDIFIPSENLIIEVKSTYTYEVDLEKNLAKQNAVLGQGFNFRFEIR